ncbi:hypothetical protein ACT3SZ_01410 [Corynebacterium sp. AOP40-9SA-29]|uniref:hypothetical protein n=1 Tax=Corynebacterium sp. AOP40-9SA-29 TaxID=3457677 RepID=UPI00403442AE
MVKGGGDSGGTSGGDAGYVTVEAAIVFTALTAVIGLVIAGVLTLATYLGAVGMARDAARAAALGDEAAAQAVVTQGEPDALLIIEPGGVPSAPGASGDGARLITVTVMVPGWLFDISASAVIIGEPQDA